MSININNAAFWDQKYTDKLDEWDMKTPSPVFVDLLNKGLLAAKRSLLVLGCGKGYDAIIATSYGLKVTGVDFSAKAIESAKTLASKNGVKLNFIVQDIFGLPKYFRTKFDYIYDYVTYCSIDPGLRREYAKTVSSLLKNIERLIFVLFPVEKRESGPPFGIDEEETKNIFSEHLTLEIAEKELDSIKPRKGREVLHIYKK